MFKLSSPLPYLDVSQPFGVNPQVYAQFGLVGHNGTDYRAPGGTPIFATHDGIVTFTGEDGGGGLGVVLRTIEKYEYLSSEVFFKTIYWHCKVGSFQVKPGDIVKTGDKIAEVDNTGFSTGNHLHFGLKPVLQGEQEWQWENLLQNNGFKGAINPELFLNMLQLKKIIGQKDIYAIGKDNKKHLIINYRTFIEGVNIGMWDADVLEVGSLQEEDGNVIILVENE